MYTFWIPIFKIANSTRTIRQRIYDNQQFGNFMAMYMFLLECLHSINELCIYLDPDIMLYRNTSGLLNLAANVFRENPSMVILSPPFGCYNSEWPMNLPPDVGL